MSDLIMSGLVQGCYFAAGWSLGQALEAYHQRSRILGFLARTGLFIVGAALIGRASS